MRNGNGSRAHPPLGSRREASGCARGGAPAGRLPACGVERCHRHGTIRGTRNAAPSRTRPGSPPGTTRGTRTARCGAASPGVLVSPRHGCTEAVPCARRERARERYRAAIRRAAAGGKAGFAPRAKPSAPASCRASLPARPRRLSANSRSRQRCAKRQRLQRASAAWSRREASGCARSGAPAGRLPACGVERCHRHDTTRVTCNDHAASRTRPGSPPGTTRGTRTARCGAASPGVLVSRPPRLHGSGGGREPRTRP